MPPDLSDSLTLCAASAGNNFWLLPYGHVRPAIRGGAAVMDDVFKDSDGEQNLEP
jgi:hypothetical protein